MTRWLVLSACFALGCASEGEPASNADAPHEAPLVALEAWSAVPRGDDPFVVDPAAAAPCSTPSYRVEAEQGWLELDTTYCSWVTVTNRALVSVEQGERLRLKVSHYDLDAPEAAEAELRLRFGACEVWSKTFPIPSAADVSEEELASPCALHATDTVLFHLHNHGQNTYQLQSVTVLR